MFLILYQRQNWFLWTVLGQDEIITNTSSRNTDVEKRLKDVGKLLSDLMKHDDAWAFLKPVLKREVSLNFNFKAKKFFSFF